jgi:hypothetical protein
MSKRKKAAEKIFGAMPKELVDYGADTGSQQSGLLGLGIGGVAGLITGILSGNPGAAFQAFQAGKSGGDAIEGLAGAKTPEEGLGGLVDIGQSATSLGTGLSDAAEGDTTDGEDLEDTSDSSALAKLKARFASRKA